VWADEATAFHGALSARGGAAGGDGGFAEISGAALAADGDVDLSASAGARARCSTTPRTSCSTRARSTARMIPMLRTPH
jgi:hypothetical protein